jgi:hypothetical protein
MVLFLTMKILRFPNPADPAMGWLYEDLIGEVDGDPFGAFRRLDPDISIDTVHLLPPVSPGRSFVLAATTGPRPGAWQQLSEIPILFLKPTARL